MTPAQKAAATRKRRAAAAKAAQTRKRRAAGAKAALTRKRKTAGRKAGETRRRKAAAKERSTLPSTVAPFDDWKKYFDAWMADVQARANRYPPGFVMDDSRESMYEGCGQ